MYAVTGATGQLGHLVVEGLLDAGVAPSEIVAIVRTPAKATDLADRGVTVRPGNYDQPAQWPAALAGVDTLLLVSASEPGQRVAQHQTVVDAAVTAGVARIVYTSVLRADSSPLILAPEHKATEELIAASGLPFTFLRNGWYTENYTGSIGQYVAQGAIVGATEGGRVSVAARADYAAAAVAVLTGTDHANVTHELGGTAITMADLADAITEVTGSPVGIKDVSLGEYVEILKGAGLDDGTAFFVGALDEATARGDLYTDSTDLVRLIGRPVTPLIDVVRAAV